MEYTYSSQTLKITKKNNLDLCKNLFYVDVPKLTSVKLDLFPCLARDGKSPPKKLICIGEKSVPQTACLSSEVKK